jgi:dolichyl-phosphate beta-glucosyltransferase
MIPDISIVLPCYNSANKIPKSLNVLSSFLGKLERQFEIIVSDDGSNDETQAMDWTGYSSLFNLKYIRNNINKGKGEALRSGFHFCTGRFIFFMDIDLPVQLNALEEAWRILEKDEADLVIGDRKITGSLAIGAASRRRFVASKIFNIGVQLMALPGYMDTQCPLKGFNASKLKSILPYSFLTSFAFDVELIYLFEVKGYKVKKVSVIWKDDRSFILLSQLTNMVLSCLVDVAKVRLKTMRAINS